jgi:hypothetical protein
LDIIFWEGGGYKVTKVANPIGLCVSLNVRVTVGKQARVFWSDVIRPRSRRTYIAKSGIGSDPIGESPIARESDRAVDS